MVLEEKCRQDIGGGLDWHIRDQIRSGLEFILYSDHS